MFSTIMRDKTTAARYDAAYRPKFGYYHCGTVFEALDHDVVAITFDVSRYGKHTKTLYFKDPIHETSAVKAAETFLSEPMDLEYYNKIKDDVFGWTSKMSDFAMRGDALGDCRFLEALRVIGLNSDGRHIKIVCGS